MVNIKVPIGRGAVLQPQQEKQPNIKAQVSDFQFFRELEINGNMIRRTGQAGASGGTITSLTITPPSGSTLFIKSVVVASSSGQFGAVDVIWDSSPIENIAVNANETQLMRSVPYMCIGDGTKQLTIDVIDGFASPFAQITTLAWFENTQKQTEIPTS